MPSALDGELISYLVDEVLEGRLTNLDQIFDKFFLACAVVAVLDRAFTRAPPSCHIHNGQAGKIAPKSMSRRRATKAARAVGRSGSRVNALLW
jgi:hypothetical protein